MAVSANSNREIEKIFQKYGRTAIRDMISILRTAGKDASGTLINSFAFELKKTDTDNWEMIFTYADYGKYVDKGRRPGTKPPPISKLKEWLRIKGLPESAAFPIAKKIGRFGIKATPFLFKITEDQDQLIEALEKQLSRDVILDVTDLPKEIK